MNIDTLIALEPELGALLAEIRETDTNPHPFCANSAWFGYKEKGPPPRGYRERMAALVGDRSWPQGGVLSRQQAYDVAYQALYNAVPDCERGCACQTGARHAPRYDRVNARQSAK